METQAVQDSVPKINSEIAVGEDLQFQRNWWRFERAAWSFFLVIIVLDVLGVFGRGPLSNASASSAENTMQIQYEKIQRYGTPSIMNIRFGPNAIRDGKLRVWTSQNLVQDLGAQRVVPQPASSEVGDGGILYTFPSSHVPAEIAFSLEPARPGFHRLTIRVPGIAELKLSIFVVP